MTSSNTPLTGRITTFRGLKIAVAAVLATTTVLAFAGCASTTPTAKGTSTGGASAQVSAAQKAVDQLKAKPASVVLSLSPLTKSASLHGKTIFLIPLADQIFNVNVSSMQSAVKAAGGQTQVCDGQANPSTIDSCFKQAITAGAYGAITFGIPYQMVPNSYAALAAAKIPTVASFQDPQGASTNKYLAFQPSSPFLTTALKASAEYAIAASKGKANVLYIGSTDSATIEAVGTATHDVISANCSGCTFTDASIPTAQISSLGSVVSAKLLSNPSLNWSLELSVALFADPVAAAIQSAGKTSSISVGGAESGAVGPLQGVQSGTVKFVTIFSPDLVSWNALDTFLRLANGQSIPSKYPSVARIVDKSNVGDLTLTDAAGVGYDWFGNPTFHAQYLKLWGVN
ncbi:MAG TPA: hypothetical protein VHZ98_11875 [Galbitalea sp.]|jgi:ribose transport system substrate-binding protein|nr:hypothetical protein [Galbitalea sp.]